MLSMGEMSSQKYGYVLAGELRTSVVKRLSFDKTPNQLCAELNRPDSAISRCLKDLTENRIVQCINPDAKKGRLYSLTEEGKHILKRIADG
jgi:ArsR family transcriptional regulator, cadmium/lead-responsive transcriptional repressor